ncbi:MAG: hypothetical protein QM790_06420 [Nibricoccus sp.]
MSSAPSSPDPEPIATGNPISMVRYSLPELLAELKLERASGTLAMEKLQQSDIGNLFQNKQRRRRGKSA